MPFKSSKRDKLHATNIKESSKRFNREHFISKSMRQNESAASVNVARVRKSRVREHHSRNLGTSRARVVFPDTGNCVQTKAKLIPSGMFPCIGSEMYKKQKCNYPTNCYLCNPTSFSCCIYTHAYQKKFSLPHVTVRPTRVWVGYLAYSYLAL